MRYFKETEGYFFSFCEREAWYCYNFAWSRSQKKRPFSIHSQILIILKCGRVQNYFFTF